jgi:hypothetical protein
MSHWSDRPAKVSVGIGAVSRRAALGGLLAGLAVVGRATAQALVSPSVDAPLPPLSPNPTTCQRQVADATAVHQVSVSQGAMTETRRTTADGKGAAELVLTVTNGKALVYRIVANATKSGAGAATIFYGNAFTGAKTANITTKDGKSFTGVIDKRAFSGAGRPQSMQAVSFDDGKPAPAISFDPALNEALAMLDNAMHTALAGCPMQVAVGEGDGRTYQNMMPGGFTIAACPPGAAVGIVAALAYYAGSSAA